jgi:ferredoxin
MALRRGAHGDASCGRRSRTDRMKALGRDSYPRHGRADDGTQDGLGRGGCICCMACVQALPSVFAFPDDVDRAVIVGASRVDGATDHNEASRAALSDAAMADFASIEEAAAGCPVEVIRIAAAEAAAVG